MIGTQGGSHTSTRRALLASAIALGVHSGAAVAQFAGIVAFGDSLSDAGQFGTRFTTNPGTVWVQNLGSTLGLPVVPSTQGGTDYAVAGGRVTVDSASSPSMTTQVGTFLASGRGVDSSNLYTVWIGGNDLRDNGAALLAGQISPVQFQANLITAATQEAGQLARLNAAGARHILLLNVPDAGLAPFAAGNRASFTAASELYNTTLSAQIPNLGFDVIALDIFTALREWVADPATYGLGNVAGMACTNPEASLARGACNAATLVSPNAADSYLFADFIHPTTAGHKLVSDYALSVLEAPGKVGMLPQAPLQVYDQWFRSIDQRMRSSMGTPRPGNGVSAYAAYDHAPWEFDSRSVRTPGTDLTGNSVIVGADMPIGPLLAGLAFGYGESEADFANNGGGFEMREWSLTAYAGALVGSAGFVSGSLTLGDLDYRSVRRNITLLGATRTESAETGGTHVGATLLGGWLFRGDPITHGPIARLTWQDVKVDAFAERSRTSTAMRFDSQEVTSLVGSLGWHANASLVAGGIALRPYGRLAWETEMRQDERSVRAALLRMPGSFALPVYHPDDSWFTGELGVAADFTGTVSGFIGYTVQFDRSDGSFQAITAGVRVAM